MRPLGGLDARPLAGTEGLTTSPPFWSPDSRSVAFFSPDQLKRVDLSGGQPQMLSTVPPFLQRAKGGSWNREGVVLFTPGTAVYHVSASGGDAEPATKLDSLRREGAHALPEFLPDGRHFIYWVRSEDPEYRGVRVG